MNRELRALRKRLNAEKVGQGVLSLSYTQLLVVLDGHVRAGFGARIVKHWSRCCFPSYSPEYWSGLSKGQASAGLEAPHSSLHDSLRPSSHKALRQMADIEMFGTFVPGCYADRCWCIAPAQLLCSTPDSFTSGCRRRI